MGLTLAFSCSYPRLRIVLKTYARVFCAWFSMVIFTALSLSLAAPAHADSLGTAEGSSTDAGQCRQNLGAVFGAIQEYRHARHQLPERLADLIPLHLARAEALICPAARRAGDQESERGKAGDPAAGIYVYEFALTPLTNDLARDLGVTLRSWRQWQMGRIGSEIPMV